MITLFSIRDLVDLGKYINKKIQESKQDSVEEEIWIGISNENILICIYCCGFVDKGCDECPHCGESLGLLDNETKAISAEDFSEDKLVNTDCLNEGIYIGRYSRSEKVVLET